MAGFDPRELRREFPIFERNPGLVFLDSGASAQKPRQVIDGIAEFYRSDYANVHRGVYQLSARSTDRFEEARAKPRAPSSTPPTSARSSSCAAPPRRSTWSPRAGAPPIVKSGDEVVISDLEHHSNLVPWQMLLRARRRAPRGGADRRNRRIRPRAIRGPAVAAHPARRGDPYLQRHRRPIAGGADRRAGPRTGRTRAGRRLPGSAADAGRRPGAGLRFLRFFRPQSVWADRNRRALRALRCAPLDAALADRRWHDRQRHLREDRVSGAAASFRGRHPRYRRRGRARGGDRLYRGDRPRERSASTRRR